MADEKISLELFIEADKASMTLGDLEEGFEQMSERLKKVGRGSEEFKQLSHAMAKTSAEIKNIELGFEGLDREQVASELGSVAGAVGDLTTSFILLGGENETLEQIGQNIEKAILISMGLKGAIEGISSAQKLWNNVLKQSEAAQELLTLATKGWGKALIATGIGAIIALVATLITKWDDLTVAIGMSSKEQKLYNDVAQEAIDAVAEEISASDKLQKTLQDESISREEKNKAIIELQDEYPNLLSNIDAEKDSLDDINKALELNTKLLVLRAKQEAIASLRADEFKEQLKAQAEAQTGANVGLFESIAGFQTSLTTGITAQDIANAKTADAIKTSKEQVTVLDELNDTIQKEIDLLLEAGAVGEDEVNKEAERLKEAERIAKERAERRAQRLKDQQEADKKAFEERKARRDIELVETKEFNEEMYIEEEEKTSNFISFFQLIIDQKAEEHEKELARIEAERQARLAATQERLESASQIIGAIGSLNSAALATDLKNAGDNEKKKEQLRKASFEREKKLNIAMALVNGAQAQMSILAQTPKADFGIATAIAMAAAAVTTIAQIAAIKATSYQGGGSPAASESATAPSAGGAGAAGGGAAITPVSNTSTILGNQQVFVTETDITNTQNNVSVIEESATF
tara:strand:+ start:3576 stop:5489 length:1914 start_codon:yes stop_codon:yes gene_type:complete